MLVFLDGVLVDYPTLAKFAGRHAHAVCDLRIAVARSATGLAPGSRRLLIVHRPAAIELLRAAAPGDVIEADVVLQGDQILIPRSVGHLTVLLDDTR